MIAGSQGAVRQREYLAAALNVPLERVHVVCPDVGGGFGPRSNIYAEQVVVTWAARRVGRPVRWTSDRSEAFLTDYQGRDSLATARIALDKSGASARSKPIFCSTWAACRSPTCRCRTRPASSPASMTSRRRTCACAAS